MRFTSLRLASLLILAVTGCSSSKEDVAATNEALVCPGSCNGGSLSGDPLLVRVDRESGLRSDWAPQLTPLPDHYYTGAHWGLRAGAEEAFVAMLDAAYKEGVDLYCMSGYRSFDTQCSLFNDTYAAKDGCDEANTYSAHAGHSEHQLGTVCDIALGAYVAQGSSEPYVQVGDAGDQWLTAHAWEYGFANSYPFEDASQNDGYIHEPWHYRYLGKAAAAELHRRGRIAVPVFIRSLSDADRAALEGGGTPSPPPPPPPPSGCGDLDAAGRCDGTVLSWCKDGAPKSIDCATTDRGFTACGLDPNPANGHNCVVPSPCLGYSDKGTCTGSVLEWCDNGTYKRVDCSTLASGHTKCGTAPNPADGVDCIAP